MSHYTLEHTISPKKGWKHPIFTSNRVYRTFHDVMNRIRWLEREYGAENVVHEPKKGDPDTEVVYIRLY